jgi:glycosyltransferase involved in cell wall biosynthesis
MKELIYIANARMPTEKAHGIQIVKMCESFVLAGLKVDLVLPWRFNKIKESLFDYYGVEKNFKIKKLPSLDLIPLNIPKICFWIQSLSFALSVFFYLFFKKADIIYSRDSFPLFLLSFFKKNLVYEAHTFPRNFFLHKRVFKKTKAIVVITQKLKDLFIKQGMDGNKILVAPDGVDLEKFNLKETQVECRQKLNLPLDKKIVLYTGHLYKWKGVQVLARAAKFLDKDTLIVFVGGTKKDEQDFKIENKELDNILILGHQPHLKIPYYLKAADVLVLPNSADVLVLPNSGKKEISQYWTSPMKMFEYMASQRPIVASDLPSIREILNENNAILVQPDNPEALAEGIKGILQNSDFADKISKQAYEDVQQYTWQTRTERILKFVKIYEE